MGKMLYKKYLTCRVPTVTIQAVMVTVILILTFKHLLENLGNDLKEHNFCYCG
jgi:hypothetical protein